MEHLESCSDAEMDPSQHRIQLSSFCGGDSLIDSIGSIELFITTAVPYSYTAVGSAAYKRELSWKCEPCSTGLLGQYRDVPIISTGCLYLNIIILVQKWFRSELFDDRCQSHGGAVLISHWN